ncbi:hypothetical protein CERSUDRAFT_98693 [Gelatoporia subvermispora B]|uniref:Uncharacterized protein n=1 Tax=Ceriporiopsis subvermispora (strain B) TaxID=914234 RepID=M2QLQ4_CERS8|nr:hypothetical protein CERSUDRAFT_98693 [Gelatoporia subvermispora B]
MGSNAEEAPRTNSGVPSVPTPVTEPAPAGLQHCQNIVDTYQRGEISRLHTNHSLTSVLLADSSNEPIGDDGTYESYLSYIGLLDAHDTLVGGAPERSEPAVEPTTENNDEPGDPAREDLPVGLKRPRSRSKSPADDDSGRRHCAQPEQWPWVVTDRLLAGRHLSSSCRNTLHLLQTYGVEPKYTRTSVMQSASVPAFPESEWTNVLAGKPVNLDKVLSSIFSLGRDDKQAERIGEFELSHAGIMPVRRVRTEGEWYRAWNVTVEATSFTFPHRRPELLEYGRYVSEIFSSVGESHQQHVLDFDNAVRQYVATHRNLELTDTGRFASLHTKYLQSIGAGANSEPSRNWD